MRYLTVDQHRQVVERLVAFAKKHTDVKIHSEGIEYTSLMICFSLHSIGVAESLLALHARFGNEWFPTTTGYLVVRSLFEVDVTAHYISMDPKQRSKRYVNFERVIRKNALDAIERNRVSHDSSWREGLQLAYNNEYAPRKAQIEADYNSVRSTFEDRRGKRAKSWSGKSIYAMAKEVDHVEAYEIFYADLSSFTHVNVQLANRFLRLRPNGVSWTMKASAFDVGNVFRYAATFLTCFLQHFGKVFDGWDAKTVEACWDF
jgi:hypothetical protein